MTRFFKIFRYLGNYKPLVVLNILSNILYVVFNLLSLLLFIPFLELLFSGESLVTEAPGQFEWTKDYFLGYFNHAMGQRIIEGGALSALGFICGLTLLMFFLKNLARYLAHVAMAGIRQGMGRDIRREIYAKVLELPLGFFSDERKGDIIARNTTDVTEVDSSIIGSMEMVFRDPLNILISIGAMLLISPQLTLFSLILLPVSGIVIGRISKSLKRTSRKGQDKQGEILSFLEETLGGLRIIKAFNAQERIQATFDGLNESYRRISTRLLNKRDLASPTSEFLGACVMVGLVYFGGRLILSGDGSLTGPEFIGFIILFSQSLRPIQSISKTASNINKGLASLDRIDEIRLAESDILDPESPKALDGFQASVHYQDVHFDYGQGPVLQGIDFELKKGMTIALVGESGGGKSTIADLLPRFYDPVQGGVLIDGVDLRELRTQDIRGLLGVVSQQPILFNDSVWNNITLGKEATQEEVEQAARTANAHEFIQALPEGYQTNIGDSGGKLSGGQRQRLSIARAVLKNPPILILDEATSALDTESEQAVQQALDNLMKERTSLIIAHRLSTIQHADRILVIQGGCIVESGTHDELLAQAGVYQRLIEMQGMG